VKTVLDVYMDKLPQPLPYKEQDRLIRLWKNEKDPIARERVLVSNLRLVITIATELKGPHSSFADLIQAGNVGILRAMEKFDPDNGAKFSTFAAFWIKAMIQRQKLHEAGPIRLDRGREGRKIVHNFKKAEKELIKKKREPTPENIAKVLKVGLKQVKQIAALMHGVARLDKEFQGSGKCLLDLFFVEETTPEDESCAVYEYKEMLKLTKQFATTLDERELDIWQRRTVAEEPETLVAIAKDWGVHKERIRQVEKAMKRRFKEFYTNQSFRYKGIG